MQSTKNKPAIEKIDRQTNKQTNVNCQLNCQTLKKKIQGFLKTAGINWKRTKQVRLCLDLNNVKLTLLFLLPNLGKC